MMKQDIIRSISQEVYRRFPEFAGRRPKVQEQRAPGQTGTASQTYLLTFQTKASLPGKKSLSRWVRVVVNGDGKIIKITTSR